MPEFERKRRAWSGLLRVAFDLATSIFLFLRNSREFCRHWGGGISFKIIGSDLKSFIELGMIHSLNSKTLQIAESYSKPKQENKY